MKLLSVLVALMVGLSAPGFGQNQNNKWYFGYNGALDFNSGAPVSLAGSAMQTSEGSASVADPVTGALLFYTNGIQVWNALNLVMPNGNGLLGGSPALTSSTTAALIVPKPFTPGIYYLFTVDEQFGGNGFRYSVIDMSLNGGLGDVMAGQKNILLLAGSAEKAAVALTSDGCGFWVLAHELPGDTFYAWKLLQSGLVTTPVTSAVGQALGNGAGYMKVNPQNDKVANTNVFGSVDLLDFNSTTGVLSNAITFPVPAGASNFTGAYGVEFSPNSNLLYVTDLLDRLVQFNLTAGTAAAIAASATTVGTLTGMAGVQRGPDGKLYIANGGVSVVNFPNAIGAACGFVANAVLFSSGGSSYGLPMEVIYPTVTQGTNSIAVADSCAGNALAFSLANTAGIQSVSWDFGDPASGAANTATTFTPQKTYTLPGSYTITAIISSACATDTVQRTLNVISCAPPAIVSIKTGDTCNLTVPIQLAGQGNFPLLSWNFGDPASGAANTVVITNMNPASHTFSAPGVYTITLVYQELGFPLDTITRTVSIGLCCGGTITATDSCWLLPLPFSVQAVNGTVNSVSWNFGDPASGASNTVTGLTPTHTFTTPGNYIITAIVDFSCGPDTLTRTVQVQSPGVPVTGFSYGTPVCILGANPLPNTAGGFTPGGLFTATNGLVINPATGTVNLALTNPGNFTITYTVMSSAAACLAMGSSTANLVILPGVQPVTGFTYPASPVCANAGNQVPVTAGTFATGGTFSTAPGLGLNATTGAVSPTNSTPGVYTVRYSVGVEGCRLGGIDSAKIEIIANTSAVTAFSYPTPLCSDVANPSPVLAAGFTAGGLFSTSAGLAIDPTTGAVNLAASMPGTYSVAYTVNAAGCRFAGSSAASLELISATNPVTAFAYDGLLCGVRPLANPSRAAGFTPGGSFSATAGLLVDAATGAIDLIRTAPGGYVVTYSVAQNLCASAGQSEDSVTIEPVEIPVTDFAFPEILSCEDTLSLPELAPGFSPDGVFTSSSRLNINSVTGEIDREASGLGQFTIYYEVEGEGCRIPRGSVAEVVVPDCTCRLVLPDAFTPNGDDANAVFGPFVTCGVDAYMCTIYDRWGERVFRSGSLDFPWDGLLPDGKPAPEGVYLAKVEGVFPDGRDIQVAGTVMLVR